MKTLHRQLRPGSRGFQPFGLLLVTRLAGINCLAPSSAAGVNIFCLRTSRGYYALVSNANPAGRNPLCLFNLR
jgi:hypothetical protein